jgi:hypothetical protein
LHNKPKAEKSAYLLNNTGVIKMIYQTVNKHQFIDSFKSWDTYANHFSYEGLELLYDWLDESGDEELDVVALCCDFTESDVTTIQHDYELTEDTTFDEVLEYLQDNTIVVGVTEQKTIVYYTF